MREKKEEKTNDKDMEKGLGALLRNDTKGNGELPSPCEWRKDMKKIIFLLTAFVLTAATLTGCAGEGAGQTPPNPLLPCHRLVRKPRRR